MLISDVKENEHIESMHSNEFYNPFMFGYHAYEEMYKCGVINLIMLDIFHIFNYECY